MRILIVDDDEVFREELSTLLSDDGHETTAVPSVKRALEFLEGEAVDVIFTDLKMHRQSGLDLLEEVRQRWPQTPTVMITGFATVSTAVEAMKRGAFDYLAKPFRGDQVRQILKLVEERQKFRDPFPASGSAGRLAETLHRSYGVPILLAMDGHAKPAEGVEQYPFDGQSPSELLHAAEEFLARNPKGGCVVAQVERMFAGHRADDILAVLGSLRERFDSKGPLAVTVDPSHIPAHAVAKLRSLLTATEVQNTLEVLANPIRRRALVRLSDGAASFGEVMRACGLEDSPKMTFHLHRLEDEGLIARKGEEYALTEKGRRAVSLLHVAEESAASSPSSSVVLHPSAPAKKTN